MASELSRRALLGSALIAPALLHSDEKPIHKLGVCIFSKHLQFLAGEELAQTAARLGFDGVDLTVRKGGHVEPERVAQDLPPLVALMRAHALATPMVTTDIVDAQTPHAEAILRTLAGLGIRNYRWGGFKYDPAQPYPAQLDRFKTRIAGLAALNARHGVCAMYHTHSGVDLVGASIWDLYILLKEFNPEAVAINYDVGHATIEGGVGGWIDSFRIAGPHLRGIAIKDFRWARNGRGDWTAEWTPLGQGMVRFPRFFEMVKKASFAGPVQLHFEYPLGGADGGKRALTLPREQVLGAMARDLATLRGYLAAADV